jgi:hypothetical protein
MAARQLDGLVEQLGFVFEPRGGVMTPQPGQDWDFGFSAHVVVAVG